MSHSRRNASEEFSGSANSLPGCQSSRRIRHCRHRHNPLLMSSYVTEVKEQYQLTSSNYLDCRLTTFIQVGRTLRELGSGLSLHTQPPSHHSLSYSYVILYYNTNWQWQLLLRKPYIPSNRYGWFTHLRSCINVFNNRAWLEPVLFSNISENSRLTRKVRLVVSIVYGIIPKVMKLWIYSRFNF